MFSINILHDISGKMKQFHLTAILSLLVLLLAIIWLYVYIRPQQRVYSWDEVQLCTLPAIGAKCKLVDGSWVPYGPQFDGSSGVVIH